MIIYNVTVNVEGPFVDDWLDYMLKTHIPEVMEKKCFESFSVNKILSKQEGETGETFAIQYRCKDIATYERYQQEFAPALQKDHTDKFGGKFVAFRTLLEQIA